MMIQWFKNHRHLINVGDGSDYTGIRAMHIRNEEIRNNLAMVGVNIIGEIRKTSDQIVYPEMVAINEWPIGGIQNPHLDTYSNQQMTEGTMEQSPAREWTCILYLNDNYRGGRTYVPNEQVFDPMQGCGLLFQGIYIPHGVEKVRRHPRYTVSFWFTTDFSRSMPLLPVEISEYDNEDAFRKVNPLKY